MQKEVLLTSTVKGESIAHSLQSWKGKHSCPSNSLDRSSI